MVTPVDNLDSLRDLAGLSFQEVFQHRERAAYDAETSGAAHRHSNPASMQMISRWGARLFAIAAAALVAGAPAQAQSTANRGLAPDHEVNVDLTAIGVAVGFAQRTSEHMAMGLSIGLGGNWWNYMVLGGRHFAGDNGLSHESKDGYTGKFLGELAHASFFLRRYMDGRQLDVGVKVSGFFHSDSSDDDPGGGFFVGAHTSFLWWQRGRWHLGSDVDIGRYAESGHGELGVNVAPLKVRLTF